MRRAIVGTGCLFALCRGIDSIVVPGGVRSVRMYAV